MNKLIYGMAVNDANYKLSKRKRLSNGVCKKVWECPFYSKWVGMLTRCYSKAEHKRRPSYSDCTVCKDWLLFSNFKKWMEKEDWLGKDLDKDLFGKGNKEYSPLTCVFISPELNSFLGLNPSKRGNLPLGVSFNVKKDRYRSRIKLEGKENHLGTYDTILEAHYAWQVAKIEVAKVHIRETEDTRVVNLLERLIGNIKEDIERNSYTERWR
ncbi:hypothetical protein VPBG_00153 [Vibrio phage helene 12B3]|uniref:HNH endonuclease n=1 Tax=Vibrio phage helene 12B3 TaxID=573173 RepID=UPI0002C04BF1|nr:HNH endonuclease [Vibrio phage helene 12B3]YP_009223024.1 HNH endonuclease [Vibrio phage eugene 12A10]AGG57925.1 hypothetical protein VPBG_00153 [Vibrio phage helene 12B3]AGN51614.1 hypothetical protein VPLG_00175 [Vibrio phage eugene 12A10]